MNSSAVQGPTDLKCSVGYIACFEAAVLRCFGNQESSMLEHPLRVLLREDDPGDIDLILDIFDGMTVFKICGSGHDRKHSRVHDR